MSSAENRHTKRKLQSIFFQEADRSFTLLKFSVDCADRHIKVDDGRYAMLSLWELLVQILFKVLIADKTIATTIARLIGYDLFR